MTYLSSTFSNALGCLRTATPQVHLQNERGTPVPPLKILWDSLASPTSRTTDTLFVCLQNERLTPVLPWTLLYNTGKTVHAFIHFVARRSLGAVIRADVQGSTGRLARTGQDGIILFDFMTHTPQGQGTMVEFESMLTGLIIKVTQSATHLLETGFSTPLTSHPVRMSAQPKKRRVEKTSTTRSRAFSKRTILSSPVIEGPIKTEYPDIEESPQEDDLSN
ncbi:hypothetical protein M407DRAFT_24524 [Tulasnella calospora MUT 4182]|uniref:Uncharacterized protein n=1 Tax=Tulasnella calospora MUT 4182 TaxID=1051891 RepID=A0A0C3KXR2_9AGAM|nr:hypothetical protein M407DRAFT_24524 [Tulasnella calospora MUT 4182]